MLSHPLYERLLARLQHLQGHCPSTRLQVVFFPSCPEWKHHHLPILLKGNLIFGIIAIARYNAFWLLWKTNIFSWNIAVLLCTWTLSHIILSVCIVPVNQPLHLPATSSFYKLRFFYCSFSWFVRVLYVCTWNIIRPTLYFPPPTLQISIHNLQLRVLLLTFFSSFSFSIPSSYHVLDQISAVQMCTRLWGHPLDHGRVPVNTVSKWHGSTFSCSCQLPKAPCNGWGLESASPIHARVEAGICRQPQLRGVHDCNSPVTAEDSIAQRPSLSSCSYVL